MSTMKFAQENTPLPKGWCYLMIIVQRTGHVLSPSGGWFLNKEDDLYIQFENLDEAKAWAEDKAKRSNDISILLYKEGDVLVEEIHSPIRPYTYSRPKAGWKTILLRSFGKRK